MVHNSSVSLSCRIEQWWWKHSYGTYTILGTLFMTSHQIQNSVPHSLSSLQPVMAKLQSWSWEVFYYRILIAQNQNLCSHFWKNFHGEKLFFFPPFFPFSASGLRQSWSRKDLSDMGKSKLPHPNSLNMKPLFRGVELYIWTPVLLMDNLWMASVLGVEKFRFWL